MKAPGFPHRKTGELSRIPSNEYLRDAIANAITMEAAWNQATRSSFAAFKAAGEALAAKKESLEHGQWIPWLKENMPAKYRDEPWDETGGAWGRTARNWMRIAHIIAHAHPAALESAQTVAQLFRLGQLLPEGGGTGGDVPELEMGPPQIVSRVQRWVASTAPLLTPERVKGWPREERDKLLEQLAPVRAILDALEA